MDNISENDLDKLKRMFAAMNPEQVERFLKSLGTERIEAFSDAMQKFSKSDLAGASKSVDDFADNVRKGRDQYKNMGPVLKGLREAMEDGVEEMEGLNKQIEDYDEKLKELSKGTDEYNKVTKERNAADEKRKNLDTLQANAKQQYTHHIKKASLAIAGAGIGEALTNAALAYYRGTKEMVKVAIEGFQSGANSIDLATGIMAARMTRNSETLTSVLDAAGAAAGAEFATKLASATEKERLDLAKTYVRTVSTQLKQTSDGYNSVAKAGILAVGGMTGLGKQATDAGVRVQDWSKALSSSSEILKQTGLSYGAATKVLATSSKELRKSGLGLELRGLGFEEVAEQTELAAETMRRMSTAGYSQEQIQKNLSAETVKYAKGLKVLSAITEGDAKAKLEAARMASLDAAVKSKLKTPEEQAKFEALLAQLPKELHAGAMDMIAYGATTDKAFNIAMAQNAELGTLMKSSATGIFDASVGLDEYNQRVFEGRQRAGETAATSGTIQRIAAAERATGERLGGELQTSMIRDREFTKGKTYKEVQAEVDKAAKPTDKLTTETNRLAEASNTAAVALEDKLAPAMLGFAEKLNEEIAKIKSPLDMLMAASKISAGEAKPKELSAVETAGSAVGGAAIGAALGTVLLPGIGTMIGAKLGAVGGAVIGPKVYELVKTFKDEVSGVKDAVGDVPKKKTGGIVDMPATGGLAELHGTEAVVPLPDGKTIPVSLDLSSLATPTPSSISESVTSTGKDNIDIPKIDFASTISQDLISKSQQLAMSMQVQSDSDLAQRSQIATQIRDSMKEELSYKSQIAKIVSVDFNRATQDLVMRKSLAEKVRTELVSGLEGMQGISGIVRSEEEIANSSLEARNRYKESLDSVRNQMLALGTIVDTSPLKDLSQADVDGISEQVSSIREELKTVRPGQTINDLSSRIQSIVPAGFEDIITATVAEQRNRAGKISPSSLTDTGVDQSDATIGWSDTMQSALRSLEDLRKSRTAVTDPSAETSGFSTVASTIKDVLSMGILDIGKMALESISRQAESSTPREDTRQEPKAERSELIPVFMDLSRKVDDLTTVTRQNVEMNSRIVDRLEAANRISRDILTATR